MADQFMTEPFYQIPLQERLQLLQQDGFVRDRDHIWRHHDGRAVGESVVAAITDDSFLRYLDPELMDEAAEEKTKAGSSA